MSSRRDYPSKCASDPKCNLSSPNQKLTFVSRGNEKIYSFPVPTPSPRLIKQFSFSSFLRSREQVRREVKKNILIVKIQDENPINCVYLLCNKEKNLRKKCPFVARKNVQAVKSPSRFFWGDQSDWMKLYGREC